MAALPRSVKLRAFLRKRILQRLKELELDRRNAGMVMGMTKQQLSLLYADEDVFTFDRLADAAERLALDVRVQAVRPWRS